MRKILLRSFIAVAAFTIGVAAFGIWIFNHNDRSQEQTFKLESEIKSIHDEYDPLTNEVEEYNVYSSVLGDERYKADLFLVLHEAQHYDRLPDNLVQLDDLNFETILNFGRSNGYFLELKNNFAVSGRVRLLSSEEHGEIINLFRQGKKGLKTFNRIYPKARGTMIFSRVGFDPERTQALVKLTLLWGEAKCRTIDRYVCGEIKFLLLTKEAAKWIVKDTIADKFPE